MPFKITTLSFNKEGAFASGGFVMVKNILLFLTFLCMLAGLILIGGGSFIVSSQTNDGVLNLSGSVAVAAIVIGLLITIVSFFGCFGAANEKSSLLKTYFAFLIILIILELSVGIAASVKKNEIPQLLEKGWTHYYNNNNAEIAKVELMFQCCGFRNTSQMAVYNNCTSDQPVYSQSCLAKVSESLQNSLDTIAGAGIALGLIEIIGMILSGYLFNRLAKRQDANQGLLNETWRINQNRVQYGYQNYQYA